MHAFITCLLWYIAVGSIVWAVLFGNAFADAVSAFRARNGRAAPRAAILIASCMLILAWPLILWAVVRGGAMVRRAQRSGR